MAFVGCAGLFGAVLAVVLSPDGPCSSKGGGLRCNRRTGDGHVVGDGEIANGAIGPVTDGEPSAYVAPWRWGLSPVL